MRTVGLLIVLGILGFLVYLLVTGGEATPEGSPRPVRNSRAPLTDSSQCAPCHPGPYREWKGSQHEIAWKNPLVGEISNQFQDKICLDCHAPRPVLASGLGARVLARDSDRDDGVNCFSCHDLGGGRMAASRAGLEGPCNPVRTPALATVEHCSVCHNQHGTVDEWRETDYAAENPPRGCVECHMPEVERRRPDGTLAPGRDHTMHAAHDLEVLRRAPEVRVELGDGTVRIAVTNRGAGHNFPTDERARAVDLVVRVLDEKGEPAGPEHRDRYRNPYRDEVGLKNTQIRWGETRTYEFPLGIPRGSVEVLLLYKVTPFLPDEEGVRVFERTVAFPGGGEGAEGGVR